MKTMQRRLPLFIFVGSVPVAQHVYRTGTQNLKRVQALAGAKNHLVVMPDADKKQVINNLVGASCGAAGQRCMAISAAIFVGESASWLSDVKEAMAAVSPSLLAYASGFTGRTAGLHGCVGGDLRSLRWAGQGTRPQHAPEDSGKL